MFLQDSPQDRRNHHQVIKMRSSTNPTHTNTLMLANRHLIPPDKLPIPFKIKRVLDDVNIVVNLLICRSQMRSRDHKRISVSHTIKRYPTERRAIAEAMKGFVPGWNINIIVVYFDDKWLLVLVLHLKEEIKRPFVIHRMPEHNIGQFASPINRSPNILTDR